MLFSAQFFRIGGALEGEKRPETIVISMRFHFPIHIIYCIHLIRLLYFMDFIINFVFFHYLDGHFYPTK